VIFALCVKASNRGGIFYLNPTNMVENERVQLF
jgi:hypothetical protein